MTISQIETRDVVACLLCGITGSPLYTQLEDRLFGCQGTWDLWSCNDCKIIWLNPQPIPEEIHKLYENYYTHLPAQNFESPRFKMKIKHSVLNRYLDYSVKIKGVGAFFFHLLAVLPPIRERVLYGARFLPYRRKGRLLDVGCGAGGFLAQMQRLGWTVAGVEPDPAAACRARDLLKAPIHTGFLEGADFDANSFDAITLHHVIEHLPDPLATLRHCFKLLKPDGKLSIVTPNIESLGHRVYRRFWRGLEPPRHLVLFSPRALRRAVEDQGFRVSFLGTTARWGDRISAASREIRRHPQAAVAPAVSLLDFGFLFVEEVSNWFNQFIGEEIGVVAVKENTA